MLSCLFVLTWALNAATAYNINSSRTVFRSGFFGASLGTNAAQLPKSPSLPDVGPEEGVFEGFGCSPTVMRVSRRGSKLRGQDFSVSKLNEERKSNAGKKGGAGYVDPNKLFVGNLAFSVTEDQLLSWFESKGYGTHVSSCKIIRDWKTGDSKGYAFASFTDPIFATSAMESLTNHELEGRIVRLSQGQRKRTEAEVAFVTKDRRNVGDLTEEVSEIEVGSLLAFLPPVYKLLTPPALPRISQLNLGCSRQETTKGRFTTMRLSTLTKRETMMEKRISQAQNSKDLVNL